MLAVAILCMQAGLAEDHTGAKITGELKRFLDSYKAINHLAMTISINNKSEWKSGEVREDNRRTEIVAKELNSSPSVYVKTGAEDGFVAKAKDGVIRGSEDIDGARDASGDDYRYPFGVRMLIQYVGRYQPEHTGNGLRLVSGNGKLMAVIEMKKGRVVRVEQYDGAKKAYKVSSYTDYKRVEGIDWPCRVTMTIKGRKNRMTEVREYSDVRINRLAASIEPEVSE